MTAAELATPSRVEWQRFTFYAWSGIAMAVVAVVGFVPTFWLPLAQGVPERFPLFAVHGMLCYGWIAFLIYQSWLAGSGRVARHPALHHSGVFQLLGVRRHGDRARPPRWHASRGEFPLAVRSRIA